MQFYNHDFSYDEEFAGYSSASIMHVLFDGFIQPSLGNTIPASLDFFQKMLSHPEFINSDASRLINKSIEMNRKIDSEYLYILPAESNRLIEDTADDIIKNAILYFGVEMPPNDIEIMRKNLMYLSKIYDEETTKPSKLEKEVKSQDDEAYEVLNIIIKSFQPLVTKFLETNPEGIIESGWEYHLVGFYYKIVSDQVCQYGFFNSGQGINHHEQKDGKYSVSIFYEDSFEILVKMVTLVFAFKHIFLPLSGSDTYHEIFYDFLKLIGFREHYPPSLEKMRWIDGQLSGSCSYHGFLYVIKYIFYSTNDEARYHKFHKHIIHSSVDKLLTHLENNRYLSQKHKHLLNLIASPRRADINTNFDARIRNLYSRYLSNVSQYTNIDFNRNVTRKMMSIYLVDNKEIYISDILPEYDESQTVLNNLNTLFTSVEYLVNSKQVTLSLTILGKYLCMSYIFNFVSHIVNLEEINGDNKYDPKWSRPMSATLNDETSMIPKKILDLYLMCKALHLHFFKDERSTIDLIQLLFKLILIRFNESNNYCYFPKSTHYEPKDVYEYYVYLNNIHNLHRSYYSDFVPVSDKMFSKIREYYDITLSKKYVKKLEHNSNIKMDLMSYAKLLHPRITSMIKPENLALLQNTTDTTSSVFFSILFLMGPIRFKVTYGDDISSLSYENFRFVQTDSPRHIEFANASLHSYDSTNLSATMTQKTIMLQLSQHFHNGTVESINGMYDEYSIKQLEESVIVSKQCVNINSPLRGKETLHSLAITLNNDEIFAPGLDDMTFQEVDDLYKISNSFSYREIANYIDEYNIYKEATAIMTSVTSLTKIFDVLDDAAILMIMSIVLYYHKKTLLEEKNFSLIKKKCMKKITDQNYYSIVFKFIIVILDDNNSNEYVTDVYDYMQNITNQSVPSIVPLMDDQRNATLRTIDILFWELFGIYLGDMHLKKMKELLKSKNSYFSLKKGKIVVSELDMRQSQSPLNFLDKFLMKFNFKRIGPDDLVGTKMSNEMDKIFIRKDTKATNILHKLNQQKKLAKYGKEYQEAFILYRMFGPPDDPQRQIQLVSIIEPFVIPFISKINQKLRGTLNCLKNIKYYTSIPVSDSIYIEFNNCLSKNTRLPLMFRLDKNLYFIDDNFKEHVIITTDLPYLINQWIYGIPMTFVYREDFHYKIIYVDNPEILGGYFFSRIRSSEWWISHRTENEYYRDTQFDKIYYHVAQIEYHGLGCNFTSLDSLRSYIASCIGYSKPEQLDILLPKYLEIINKLSEQNREFLDKEKLIICIKNGRINNPYTHYFQFVVARGLNISYFYPEKVDDPNEEKIEKTRDIFENLEKNYMKRQNLNMYNDAYTVKSTTPHQIDVKILHELPPKIAKMQPASSKYAEKVDQSVHGLRNHILDINTDVSETAEDRSFQNIIASITKFNSKYKECILDKFDVDKYRQLQSSLLTEYDKALLTLEKQKDFRKLFLDSRENFITKLSPHFYQLLKIRVVYNIVSDLIKLEQRDQLELSEQHEQLVRPKPPCLEVKTIYDNIDRETIYQGSRSTNIILLEILSGFFIRKEQYDIYRSIVSDIDSTELSEYGIHQLLMGRGKSTVIMPLIIFHYLYQQKKDIRNIFTVLPQHLVKPTLTILYDKFYPILGKIKVASLKIDRIGNLGMSETMFRLYHQDIFERTDQKKLFITTDTSYKSIKLNECLLGYGGDRYDSSSIHKNSVVIFDEFDYQYEPSRSDLNFPIKADSLKANPIIPESVQRLFVDFIVDHFPFENKYHIPDAFIRHVVQSSNEYDEITLRTTLTYGILSENVPSEFRLKYYTIYCMYKQFIKCLDMLYRKDYGFPQKNSHAGNMIYYAVPYSASDTPVSNSEYSDVDISILLTILTHVQHEIRVIDVENIVLKSKDTLKDFQEMSNHDINNMFRYIGDILDFSDVATIRVLRKDRIKSFSENILTKINTSVDKMRRFKKYYLMKEILPQIKFTISQLNCSFMDVITRQMCRYKAAFSGTVFVDLPTYTNKRGNFTKIVSNEESNGATYCAILGIYQESQTPKTLHHVNNNDPNMLDYVMDILLNENYQVFIDAGALLRSYVHRDVIQKFKNMLPHKYIVYVDEYDQVQIHQKGIGNIPYTKQTNTFDSSELFIYYDNKHTVGTDIKQPYRLSGLVSVSSFNNLVEISQATFRMRNLNYGHSVNFIINNVPDIVNRENLVYHLHSVLWKNIDGSTKIKKLEQELKSRLRPLHKLYHKERVFNKYLNIQDDEDLVTTNLNTIDPKRYMDHVSSKWIVGRNLERIFETIKKSVGRPDLSKLGYPHDTETYDVANLLNSIREAVSKGFDNAANINVNLNQDTHLQKDSQQNEDMNTSQNLQYKTLWNIDSLALLNPLLYHIPFGAYMNPGLWKYYSKFFQQYAYFGSSDPNTEPRRYDIVASQKLLQIYFSPLLKDHNYLSTDFWYESKKNITEHPEYPSKYIRMLDAYNYYYIKLATNEVTYILISSTECLFLLSFVKRNPKLVTRDFCLKDKRGNILLGHDNSNVTARELYVRLLLGKKMTNTEMNIVSYYILRLRNRVFSTVINEFSFHYKVPLVNETFSKRLSSMINYDTAFHDCLVQNEPSSCFMLSCMSHNKKLEKSDVFMHYLRTLVREFKNFYDIAQTTENIETLSVSQFIPATRNVEIIAIDKSHQLTPQNLLFDTHIDTTEVATRATKRVKLSGGSIEELMHRLTVKKEKYKKRYLQLKEQTLY